MRYIKCMNFSDEQLNAISQALYNDYVAGKHVNGEFLIGARMEGTQSYIDESINGNLIETFGLIISRSALGLSEQMLEIINRKAETLFKEELLYGVKDPDTLSAIVAGTMGSFANQQFYPGIVKKAAAYWYKIATSQVFHNGNKRTALLSAIYMLNYNGLSIANVTGNQLYDISLRLAKKQMTKAELEQFILSKLTVHYYPSAEDAHGHDWTFKMDIQVDNPNN